MCKDNKIIRISFLSLSVSISPTLFHFPFPCSSLHLRPSCIYFVILFCLVLLLLFGYSLRLVCSLDARAQKQYPILCSLPLYVYISIYSGVCVHVIWFQCRMDDKSRYVGSAFHRICSWQVKATKNTSRTIRFLFVVQHIILFVCDQGRERAD